MQKIRVIDDVYFVSYRGNSRASLCLGLCYFLAVLMALNVAMRVTSVVVFVFVLL